MEIVGFLFTFCVCLGILVLMAGIAGGCLFLFIGSQRRTEETLSAWKSADDIMRRFMDTKKTATGQEIQKKLIGPNPGFKVNKDNPPALAETPIKPKRKYTRRAKIAQAAIDSGCAVKKRKYRSAKRIVVPPQDNVSIPPEVESRAHKILDNFDLKRVYSTSDNDISVMRTHIRGWIEAGKMDENQIKAFEYTSSTGIHNLMTVEKMQILSIFNDVRKKLGLIK